MALDYGKKVLLPLDTSPIASLILLQERELRLLSLCLLFGLYQGGLDGISLSAFGCGLVKEGEDARLYAAVQSCSDFAIELGVNIPTGKIRFNETTLSKRRSYCPGTVIISAGGNCTDIQK
jgi:phosphoribosylformylglycinamidine synthase